MPRQQVAHSLDVDVLWPRDEEHRYRLYGRRGEELYVLAAAPTPGGIGEAIFQLHQDAKEAGQTLGDQGATGILDAVEGEWIVVPWQKGSHV